MLWQQLNAAVSNAVSSISGVDAGIGESLVMNVPVGPLLAQRLRNSLVLAVLALLVVTPLSILAGVVVGLNRGRWADHSIHLHPLLFAGAFRRAGDCHEAYRKQKSKHVPLVARLTSRLDGAEQLVRVQVGHLAKDVLLSVTQHLTISTGLLGITRLRHWASPGYAP